jgi:hypothetical protein
MLGLLNHAISRLYIYKINLDNYRVNYEQEKSSKEAAVTYFKTLLQRFLGD